MAPKKTMVGTKTKTSTKIIIGLALLAFAGSVAYVFLPVIKEYSPNLFKDSAHPTLNNVRDLKDSAHPTLNNVRDLKDSAHPTLNNVRDLKDSAHPTLNNVRDLKDSAHPTLNNVRDLKE